MKTISIAKLALALLAFSSFVFAQQPAITAADYARAEQMLYFNTSPLIDRSGVNPTFLHDGGFWYRVLTATGSEYVFINPIDGARKTSASLDGLMLSPTPPPRRAGFPNGVTSPDGSRSAFIRD